MFNFRWNLVGLCLDVEEAASGDQGVHPQWGREQWVVDVCVSFIIQEAAAGQAAACTDRACPIPRIRAPQYLWAWLALSAGNGLVKHGVAQLHTRLPVAAPGPHCWLVNQLQAQAAVPGSRSTRQGSAPLSLWDHLIRRTLAGRQGIQIPD